MPFLIYFFLTILGFAFAIFIVVIIMKAKIRSMIGTDNYNELTDVFKMTKDLEIEEYARPKNVSGITKLIEPSILRDFPDFNKELLYKKVEKILGEVFNAYESKETSSVNQDTECVLIKDKVNQYIEDLKERHVDVTYSDLNFHEHAIKAYEKKDGMAIITTSSTLEYYYNNSKLKNKFEGLKKQTRYTCRFIYVFDESKVKKNVTVMTIHCPNCGAPLKGLGDISCAYCGSEIKPINLKAWKMSDIKEDYD